MAEDELIDPGALGDATALGDVGVQPGHPSQRGTGEAVPRQVIQRGHVADLDASPLVGGGP